MGRTKIDITIINKYIDTYRKEQQRIINLAMSNKKLVETKEGLNRILQVMKGDGNEIS